MLGVMYVLDHNHADEIGVPSVMIKGKGDETRQPLSRGQVIKIKRGLAFAYL